MPVLKHLDHLQDMIAELDAQVEEMMAPFGPQRDLLISIPGIRPRAWAAIVSEIGADPGSWFPTPEQLASWTGRCPGNHESAGKRHHGKTSCSSRARGRSRSTCSTRSRRCTVCRACGSRTSTSA